MRPEAHTAHRAPRPAPPGWRRALPSPPARARRRAAPARAPRRASLQLLRRIVHEFPPDGVVAQLHDPCGPRGRIVGDAGVVGARVDVQAHRALFERVGDAMDRVLALLQVPRAFRGAREAAIRDQPDSVAGSGAVEALEVLQAQRPALDGQPAELAGVVVDRALAVRLPAERDELEDRVAIDQVPGVAARREVQVGLQGARIQQKTAQPRAYLSRLEPGGWHSAQRLDDSLDRDLHAWPSFASS